jgi:hypothetical protein
VPGEHRTEEQIRGEIASEREQLAASIDDLRAGIRAKRGMAKLVAAGLAAIAALKLVRTLRD